MKLKSFAKLVALSTAVLTTAAFAHGSHNHNDVNLTPEQLRLETAQNLKTYTDILSDSKTMADFEGVRKNTNIIPVLYNYQDRQPLLNNFKILKSTPAYLTVADIASVGRENEFASMISVSPTMKSGQPNAQSDCIVIVNPSLVSESAQIEEVFQKDSLAQSQAKSVLAEYIIRHEYAHCSQKTAITSVLTSAAFGQPFATDTKFFTNEGQKNLQSQVNYLIQNYKSNDKTHNLENYFSKDNQYNTVLFTQVEESWADGLALLSLLSQNKIESNTIKALGQVRLNMAKENSLHENHNTSGFLFELSKKIESGELKINSQESVASLADKMAPLWKNYVEQVEKKGNIYDAKAEQNNSHTSPLTRANGVMSLKDSQNSQVKKVEQVEKIDFKSKINRYRTQTTHNPTHSHKM